MRFLTAYHTDVGIRKKTNQDALLLKTAKTKKGNVGLFIVCDGMGGLSHGELASATVVRYLADWFEKDLPNLLEADDSDSGIQSDLEKSILHLNEKIMSYGTNSKITLGTTVTALLTIDNTYYLAQIGDSRAYSVTNDLKQLTKDQTLVARELERGKITEEQAKVDKRRNVLLQCVGASEELEVVVTKGEIEQGALYILCSDGFYHEISEEEIVKNLNPDLFTNEQQMKDKAINLVNLVKERKEPDNISLVLLKAM